MLGICVLLKLSYYLVNGHHAMLADGHKECQKPGPCIILSISIQKAMTFSVQLFELETHLERTLAHSEACEVIGCILTRWRWRRYGRAGVDPLSLSFSWSFYHHHVVFNYPGICSKKQLGSCLSKTQERYFELCWTRTNYVTSRNLNFIIYKMWIELTKYIVLSICVWTSTVTVQRTRDTT